MNFVSSLLLYFFKHNFCVKPENPEGTQVIVGSMNMGYIILYIRHCQESNSQPVPSQAEPIPLGHIDLYSSTWHFIPSFIFCGIWECILICQVNNKYYDMKQMEKHPWCWANYLASQARAELSTGSLFLDPTRPGETLTRPDPRLPTKSLTRPDPNRGPTFPHMCIL